MSFLDKSGIVLPVIIPLLMALFLLILRAFRVCGRSLVCITSATMGVTFIISCLLVLRVVQGGPITHAFGGWPIPLSIGYQLDMLSAPFLLLINLVGFCISLTLLDYIETIVENKQAFFLALILLTICGFSGIILTQDAFNAFVFLEIASLSSCALVAYGPDRRAFYAAYNYLIMGSLGAGFYVIGVAFLYMGSGTLSFSTIHDVLIGTRSDGSVIKVAFCFIILGLLIKSFSFFAHRLLPQVYVSAPTPIVSLFSSTTAKVMVYLMLRYIWAVFSFQSVLEIFLINKGLLWVGVVGMILPAIFACFENDMKRVLAYSSLSQVSYLFVGMALLNRLALCACLIQVISHGLAKSSLFLISGLIEKQKGHCLLHKLRGYLKMSPLMAVFLCLSCASLAGMPFTLGFLGKWVFLESLWPVKWVFAAMVGGSILAFFYSLRLVTILVVLTPEKKQLSQPSLTLPWAMPLVLFLGASTVTMVLGEPLVRLTQGLAMNLIPK